MLFAYLLAPFVLRLVFADHNSEWPRKVSVVCRAEWTPDSAMEKSDFVAQWE